MLPNGCWTTTIWWFSPYDRLKKIYPKAITGSCPNSPLTIPSPNLPTLGSRAIYAAAYAFWTHEEHQLDQGRLSRFVAAYQQVHVFTMGELWAVPTMLRLALLETLAQAAGRITRQAIDTRCDE